MKWIQVFKMSHGGPRQGAGRKAGSSTRLNEAAREKALGTGISPLDYMLGILRDDKETVERRFDAAKAAAPYVHAKLANIEHNGNLNVTHEDALSELE